MQLIINCEIKPRGWMKKHQWGMVYNKETGEELGFGVHIKTNGYPRSFSVNRSDFNHSTRQGSQCKFYVFETVPGGKQIAVPVDKVINLFHMVPPYLMFEEFFVLNLSDITGEPFQYDEEMPF